MPAALVAMSHSPLLLHNQPAQEVMDELNQQFDRIASFIREYAPDEIVVFWPDHFNGFFYELMPPFCVGFEAFGTGDYGSWDKRLNVPATAEPLAQAILNAEVDIAISRNMEVDHGAVQPLELAFGSAVDQHPIIPIYVNGVAWPFAPMKRVRAMGQAVGEYFKNTDKKVLFIASGGLSHDPPLPRWHEATDEQKAMLLDRSARTAQTRAAREARVIEMGKKFARGEAPIMDINPQWDQEFMRVCASNDPKLFDAYQAESMETTAGHSVHEVRTWVAAVSALHAMNPNYSCELEYYRPIPEFIAGFGILIAH